MSATNAEHLEQELSLQWPQDCEAAHIEALLQTLGVQTIELSERIQRIHNGSGGLHDLEAAQEICQVLEDSTTTAPIPGIANMVYALHHALQDLIERQSLPNPQQAALLLAACDCLEHMYDALQGLGAPPGMAPSQAVEVLIELRDWSQHAAASAVEHSTGNVPQERLLDAVGQHTTLAARLGAVLDHYQPLIRQWQAPLHGLDPEADAHFQTLDGLFESLYQLQHRYRQINQATEQAVCHLSSQAFATLETRLQEAVQQAKRQFGKKVTLVIAGGDTLVDEDLLEALDAPLVELLSNAVEHGIEPPAERLQAGKPEAGRIVLQARQHGSTLILRCEDDGQGLQLDAIRVAAELDGMITPNQPLSEQELAQLILAAGLTTRSSSQDAAPGLHHVQTQIQALGGWVSIDHDAQGCAIEVRLPLRRVTAKLILVPLGETVYGIHERGLLDIIPAHGGRIQDHADDLRYHLEQQTYPAQLLETLLHKPVEAPAPEERTALLFQGDAGQRHIVLVATPLDSSERVVHPLGRFMPKSPGLIGISQLSNEPLIPVVDMTALLGQSYHSPTPALPRGTQVLLVDDSRSVLRSLGQVLEGADLTVSTASDGYEALAAIQRQTPDIALIDLEMPNMDGLELIKRLRGQALTHKLPIIVITARGTPEHVQAAETLGIQAYLTKPVSHTELLQQIEQALEMS